MYSKIVLFKCYLIETKNFILFFQSNFVVPSNSSHELMNIFKEEV
jgi:hypothetical protein